MNESSTTNPDQNLTDDELAAQAAQFQGKVMDLLKSNPPAGFPAPGHKLDLDPETTAEVAAALGDVRGKDQVSTPKANTPMDPKWSKKAGNPLEALSWAVDTSWLDDVTVTDEEKSFYWKGFILDQDVVFDISLEGAKSFKIRVRGLTQGDEELINAAVRMDQDTAKAIGLQASLDALQRYAVMLQTMQFDGAPFPRFESQVGYSAQENVQALRSSMQTVLGKMNPNKLMMICRAIMIYEWKIKLCNDAVANRKGPNAGFWPATVTA
jgi:hypothetical protein